MEHVIDTIEKLEALYGEPAPMSLLKETAFIAPAYRALIEASPFVVIATSGPDGLDCSPRGDPAGFVRIEDEKTILIPDRPGNNRVDSLRNILRDPRVGLLFLIPGMGETLRINGRATITVDPALRESFAMNGKPAKAVIRIAVDAVYFQCQKAIVRSDLWNAARHVERSSLPTAGAILQSLKPEKVDGEAYDRAYPERLKATMY